MHLPDPFIASQAVRKTTILLLMSVVFFMLFAGAAAHKGGFQRPIRRGTAFVLIC